MHYVKNLLKRAGQRANGAQLPSSAGVLGGGLGAPLVSATKAGAAGVTLYYEGVTGNPFTTQAFASFNQGGKIGYRDKTGIKGASDSIYASQTVVVNNSMMAFYVI